MTCQKEGHAKSYNAIIGPAKYYWAWPPIPPSVYLWDDVGDKHMHQEIEVVVGVHWHSEFMCKSFLYIEHLELNN